jgi:hypothetical protein
MYNEYHGEFQGMVIYRPQPTSELKFWQGGHFYMLYFAKKKKSINRCSVILQMKACMRMHMPYSIMSSHKIFNWTYFKVKDKN